MTTFQSQFNILAAANCSVHKRITELENNHINVKYNAENTEFYRGNEQQQINYLGYKAYDAILLYNGSDYYLMDYKGKYGKIEYNSQYITIIFIFKQPNNNEVDYGEIKITTIYSNEKTGSIVLVNELKLIPIENNNYKLTKDIIIYYKLTESNKHGFIKLKSDIEFESVDNDYQTKHATIILNENDCIIYESTENYENIKFIDLSNQISNDNSWTLPPPN